jgi:hypothetical protein
MTLASGWIAFALAGIGSGPASEPGPAPMISYTVKVVETEGLCWRESVQKSLKPVTRQGAATVWTVPADPIAKVVDEIAATRPGALTQSPKVTTASGLPARMSWRHNRELVTQVVWKGEQAVGKATPEVLRTGWHTTMIGRKLDQGILVRIVIEDTSIRAVHHLNASLEAPCNADGRHEPGDCCVKAVYVMKNQAVERVDIEVPEFASQEVAGEWLIPRGEVLLVSFGAYTVADQDGRAVV